MFDERKERWTAQGQPQAKLERQRAAQRASCGRRKERTLNSIQAQAQVELERRRVAQRASYA
jgi:hypothetical protein